MREPDATPMIHTIKGNMPVDLLDYSVEWFENDSEVGMVEEYKHNGMSVRRSVHIHKKQGMAMGAGQADFN